MYKLLLLLTLLTILFQSGTRTVSPDGKFTLTIETKGESDLQIRYITMLTDNDSKETTEIANCIRRDLPTPNFYWDKYAKYLVFEQCTESFKDSRIKILNLKTKKIDFELIGLIGNRDDEQQQFDAENSILIYFDTMITDKDKIPNLYTFDLKSKEKKRIQEFAVTMDMDFPEIQRVEGKRQIKISYNDNVSGQRMIKEIAY